jgi:predicted ribosome quality control (RQC) complex YloA/Tae2 family protein
MNLDTLSMAALATELRATLLGGRVQRVTQVNSLTFGFELYIYPIRYYLTFSVEPQAPRLHLTYQKVRRGVGNDTPLMLVLRKYMRGAKLRSIEQPPYERILHFHFDSPFTPTTFVAEMLGTRSNLALLDTDQTVLGVARLPKSASQRTLLPGNFYQPPPPQRKLLPDQLTEFTLRQELAEASPKLALTRLLPEIVIGVSPLLAREIVYRATGQTNTTVADLSQLSPLLKTFHDLFEQAKQEQWQPTLALDEEGDPLAFAPYTLTHLPEARPTSTLSEAVEIYFADAASGYSVAKQPLFAAITEARQRLARRRERLTEDAAVQANPELLKEQGEMILACAHQIRPGQAELAIDWLVEGTLMIIKLDPALSPSENAQDYFARYRKSQRAAEEIPAQLETISLEESYLDQLEQDLTMAEDRPEIDAVAGALAEAGYARAKRGHKKRQKQLSGRYLRLLAPDGATVWVGKNALQNAYLTFERASPDDLWLHARDVPGAHVVIPTAQGLPSEEDVLWTAGVAAYYSRSRNDTSVEVTVTLKKYVRSIKGAAPGLVTYRNETTLRVVPHAPDTEEDDHDDE